MTVHVFTSCTAMHIHVLLTVGYITMDHHTFIERYHDFDAQTHLVWCIISSIVLIQLLQIVEIWQLTLSL